MAVLKYSLLRLATFFILFATGLLLELGVILALIVALVGSWGVAYLFFNRLRAEAGETLARRFGGSRKLGASEHADNAAEDTLAEEYHRSQERETRPHKREETGESGDTGEPDEKRES